MNGKHCYQSKPASIREKMNRNTCPIVHYMTIICYIYVIYICYMLYMLSYISKISQCFMTIASNSNLLISNCCLSAGINSSSESMPIVYHCNMRISLCVGPTVLSYNMEISICYYFAGNKGRYLVVPFVPYKPTFMCVQNRNCYNRYRE
jgi:hypothetical protein